MRSTASVCCVVLATLVSAVAAQEPKKNGKDNKTITVVGCVDGTYLRVRESDSMGTYNDRFRLAGPKHLLKEMAALRHGNKIEVIGKVIDARGTEHVTQTTKIGKKTTVTVGASEVPAVPAADTTSTLQVQSFKETSDTCK